MFDSDDHTNHQVGVHRQRDPDGRGLCSAVDEDRYIISAIYVCVMTSCYMYGRGYTFAPYNCIYILHIHICVMTSSYV